MYDKNTSSAILYCLVILFFLLPHILSGARPALPMGVAPEATAECLHLVVGSTFATLVNSIFFLLPQPLVRSIDNISDKSSSRAYEQMLAFDHRLSKFVFFVIPLEAFLSLYFVIPLEAFLNDVAADDSHVRPPWETTTPVNPLGRGSKTLRHRHVAQVGHARPPEFPARAK